jgi:hypothetical protein
MHFEKKFNAKIGCYPIFRTQREVGLLEFEAILCAFAIKLLAAEKFVVFVVAMLSL